MRASVYHATIIVAPKKSTKNDTNPPFKIWAFWAKFKAKYLSEFVYYENTKGMKSILKFSNFSKIFKKRAWGTHNTPKPTNENLEKTVFLGPKKFGCPKPFLWKFLKSFEILKYFPYLSRFHKTKPRWDIWTWIFLKNTQKNVRNGQSWGGVSENPQMARR